MLRSRLHGHDSQGKAALGEGGSPTGTSPALGPLLMLLPTFSYPHTPPQALQETSQTPFLTWWVSRSGR